MPTFEQLRARREQDNQTAEKATWLQTITSYLSGGNYGTFNQNVREAGGALEPFDPTDTQH